MKKILLFSVLAIFLNSCSVEISIDGCTDPCAANFDPNADDDDGSCLYIAGCTDPAAYNFDPEACVEPTNACEYTCDVVYYLDYAASQYMINWGISYYSFYDFSGSWIGDITNDFWWPSPPDCLPQSDGSTLTKTLFWYGNYGSNTATFEWSAYPDDGPIADMIGYFTVYPNYCFAIDLSKKKIQEYQESK